MLFFPLQHLFEILFFPYIWFPLKYSLASKLPLTSSKGGGEEEENIC
jgi:hypothetical protein